MSARIEGTMEATELDKRFHLPGVRIVSDCPTCGQTTTLNLADRYLSYPQVGRPYNAHFCHEDQEDGEHEWSVEVIVRVSLELAPSESL